MNFVDPVQVAQKVVTGVYQGVTTAELDNLAAETTAYLTVKIRLFMLIYSHLYYSKIPLYFTLF